MTDASAERVRLVEGEPEESYSSPIGFSYDRSGLLVITYEPSWEDIAVAFANAQTPVPEVGATDA